MRKFILLVTLTFLLTECGQGIYAVNGNFNTSPVPPPPDYSLSSCWASLPDKLDAADSIPIGSKLQDLQKFAMADVFFVHPTIFTEEPTNPYLWNADVTDSVMNNKIQTTTILNQASIFNGSCRIYAPYYRQAHLYSFYTPNKKDGENALQLSYQDVKTAFEYYLKNFNEGRPIVIASHSQGSYHCERLLKDYFDGKQLQKQLVVAYLAGRAILPTAFEHIHPTENPEQVGVWAAWNTYARNHFPKDYELYFKRSQSTNPLLWNSTEDFASKQLNHGGVAQHFTFVPQLVDAQNHKGILWVNKPYIKGRAFIRKKRWHIADMNFFYMNIRENVDVRIKKYLQQDKATSSNGN